MVPVFARYERQQEHKLDFNNTDGFHISGRKVSKQLLRLNIGPSMMNNILHSSMMQMDTAADQKIKIEGKHNANFWPH